MLLTTEPTLRLPLVFPFTLICCPSAGVVTEDVGHSAGIYPFPGTLPPDALPVSQAGFGFSLHRSFLGLALLIEVSTPNSWVEASVAFRDVRPTVQKE